MSAPKLIRKAVIPAAGLGTRLLPLTKTVQKEMLPVGNKPLVQHAVEEAARSGIEEIILVVAPGKDTAESYFRPDADLVRILEQRGQSAAANAVRDLTKLPAVRSVIQDQPRGLGHAIACAREAVGSEPFGVILPDALMIAQRPVLGQLIAAYDAAPACYVATREIPPEECPRFGVLQFAPASNGHLRVSGVVEKPQPEAAPSNYGIFGRYLFEPVIFDYLGNLAPGRGGEVQLSDAISLYSHEHPVYAVCFEGTHYDVGNPLGWLEASVAIGLDDPDIGPSFRRFIASLMRN
jgi:UTP--glucose-1-phosphate uridylyltransferase